MNRLFRRACALALALCLPFSHAAAKVYTDALPKEDWYKRPLMRLTVFAAGQSDCMMLECGGERMMIDGGTSRYRGELRDALTARGVTGFTYLLNTHYHEDHSGGLYWLLHYGFTAGEYLHPYEESFERFSKEQAKVLKEARKQNVPIRKIGDGDELLLGEAVISLYRFNTERTTNGKSVIEHVRFGKSTMLLGADITGVAQTHFANALPKDVLKVDVVKAPHHGITPMTTAFADRTAPEVLIITNERKAVRRAVLQAENRGMLTLCTAKNTTVLETDGEDWYVYQTKGWEVKENP